MRWPLQPLQPFQQTQLQSPFGQSVDSLCHPWFTTTNFSYRFLIFETSATALCGTTGMINLWVQWNDKLRAMLRELAKFSEIHPHHPNDDPSWDVVVTKEHFNGTSYGIWLQTKKENSLTGTMIMKHVFLGGGQPIFSQTLNMMRWGSVPGWNDWSPGSCLCGNVKRGLREFSSTQNLSNSKCVFFPPLSGSK